MIFLVRSCDFQLPFFLMFLEGVPFFGPTKISHEHMTSGRGKNFTPGPFSAGDSD